MRPQGSAAKNIAGLLGIYVACASALMLAEPGFGYAGVRGDALRIHISTPAHCADLVVPAGELEWNPVNATLSWTAADAIDVLDTTTGALLATIQNVVITYRQCSGIHLNFMILAGDAEIGVIIDTAQLYFPRIDESVAVGRALASCTLHDAGGGGAVFAGLGPPGTPVFVNHFNGRPPAGSLFAGLIGMVTISSGSGSGSQSDPPSGLRPVGASVPSMATRVQFTLTGGDRVSAMSLFDMDPNPTDYALDSDGDGVPDWADGCPDDPDVHALGACVAAYEPPGMEAIACPPLGTESPDVVGSPDSPWPGSDGGSEAGPVEPGS